MLSVRNSHYQMKEVRGENPCCGIGGIDMELMHGVNLGGWMSQCVYEEDHYDTFISKQDIAQIAKSGFDHVRLPVDYPVLEEEDGTYRKSGFDRLYKVIDWCMEYKLNIILDLHRTYGYDFNDAGDKEKNSLFNNQDAKVRRRCKNRASRPNHKMRFPAAHSFPFVIPLSGGEAAVQNCHLITEMGGKGLQHLRSQRNLRDQEYGALSTFQLLLDQMNIHAGLSASGYTEKQSCACFSLQGKTIQTIKSLFLLGV